MTVEENYCLDDANKFFKCREISYGYDDNGNETLSTVKYYNSEDSTFIIADQRVRSYDSNNNPTQYINKNCGGESCSVSSEYNYSYNENQLLENITTSRYNNYTETLEKIIYIEYFWSPFTNEGSTINAPQEINISLSPNPVESILHINNKGTGAYKISIYSISGQLMKEVELNVRSTIDMSSLHSGIYFIRVDSQQGSIVQKIIKQ